MIRRAALSLMLLCALAAAQAPGIPPAELEAMEKLAFMVGKWEGSGWMAGPGGQRFTFQGSENIQRKLQGRVILVEGLFFSSDDKERKGPPVHETLAVLSFDPKSSNYNFATYVARGGKGNHEFKLLGERKWQWELSNPGGQVRFTTDFSDGDWFEIGERSRDGKEWTRFFEMRLKKS